MNRVDWVRKRSERKGERERGRYRGQMRYKVQVIPRKGGDMYATRRMTDWITVRRRGCK